MFYISFNKLIIYVNLLLIVLKLMAVFGQCIEIKTKTENENFESEIGIVWQFSST